MHLPDIEFHQAETVDQAAALLARYAPDARLLAGGTDILVDLKTGRRSVKHLVVIGSIAGMKAITVDHEGLRIGALVTVNELGAHPVVRERFGAILDATSKLAATQIRNMATVGGNLAGAIPSADLPPILMVMNAEVTLRSPGGERTVPVAKFFTGPRESVMTNDEILTTIRIPNPPRHFGAAFARFSLRQANACAVAGAAASLTLDEGNTIQTARIALSGVAPTPLLVESAGNCLGGRRADEAAFAEAAQVAVQAALPISDVRGSADYRRRIVAVLTRRALAIAQRRVRETGV